MLRITLLAVAITAAMAVPTRRGWDVDGCGWSQYDDAGAEREPQKIVGGWEALRNEFPYLVSIGYSGGHFCGGNVIGPNHVLTAAHCTAGDAPSRLSVTAGGHMRNDPSEEHKVVVAVSGNIVHPNYDVSGNIENDIAILVLAETLIFNAGVHPICAPEDVSDNLNEFQTSVSGWGATSSGASGTQEVRSTNVPVITRDECQSAFPTGWVDDTMMCAGNVGVNDRDSCQGDSGGPLAYKRGDAFELVGLVSWGIGCAGLTPGVYADVQVFEQWIMDNM